MRIIHHAHDRLTFGGRSDQAERRGRHQEPVRIGRRGQPERTLQRRRLERWQLAGEAENRPQEAEQPSKGQIGLGLHPRRLKYGHPGRRTQRKLEQRALANPRVAPQHERGAPGRDRASQQPLDRHALGLATYQTNRQPSVGGVNHRPAS